MISVWQLVIISTLYIASLFFVAWYGDKRAHKGKPVHNTGLIYSLSLAVYCTSWTFYGAVGQAASSGWMFVGIYLGPILFLVFFWGVFIKIIRIVKEKRITSIADFIATRYGRDHNLAIIITLVAFVGIIPYVALQLKAIASTFELITFPLGYVSSEYTPFWKDTAFYVSWIMALFVIIYGTRDIDASEQHPGMILAVAFESLIKLAALLIIGVWVVTQLYDRPLNLITQAKEILPDHAIFDSNIISASFLVQTLIAGFALLCLPRQFQVAVVENESTRHIRTARWVFPSYLFLMLLAVVPIALTGQMMLPEHSYTADTYVLSLPVFFKQESLAIIAFIGGASAATSMIIVATIAISTMISNELALPAFFHNITHQHRSGRVRRVVLTVRRFATVLIMLSAFVFYRLVGEFESLAAIGLLSFAAVAQFAPALFGGLFWQRANKQGAVAGILGGSLVWLMMLLLPVLTQEMRPEYHISTNVLGLQLDEFGLGTAISLLVNSALFAFFSVVTSTSVRERIIASDFTSPNNFYSNDPLADNLQYNCKVDDIKVVLEGVLGTTRTDQFFTTYQTRYGQLDDNDMASRHLIQDSEKLLASVVGSSSAQVIFSTLLGGEQINPRDITFLASEASQAFAMSREQLQAALENLQQGVSVIDKDFNLVAWNSRYLELFNYPADLVYVGKPVAELIKFNAERGFCGEGSVALQVRRRMNFLKSGKPHNYERQLPHGTVLSMQGHPMPDGGFVTSFTDITVHRQAEQALKEVNVDLEQQVEESTQELADLTSQLIEANTSKSRFLAAAGHDLMQPLNAAKLFASTLSQQELNDHQRELLSHLEGSLESSENVLSLLVEISKLDANVMEPKMKPVELSTVLTPLKDEFTALASQKGLTLRTHFLDLWVLGDAHWLRRIIQNLLSNAVRYTHEGGILLGCRKRGDSLFIDVWDTGSGIPKSKLREIFLEFKRLDSSDAKGLGLGLAIVDRMARRMGYELSVDSWEGKGSRFRLIVPLTAAMPKTASHTSTTSISAGSFNGLKTFVIDNDPDVLAGMNALLNSWNCEIYSCHTVEQSLEIPFMPDVMLADHQLDNDETGLQAMQTLQEKFGKEIPGILITADPRPEVEDQAKEMGFYFLRKPLKPAALRALLRRITR